MKTSSSLNVKLKGKENRKKSRVTFFAAGMASSSISLQNTNHKGYYSESATKDIHWKDLKKKERDKKELMIIKGNGRKDSQRVEGRINWVVVGKNKNLEIKQQEQTLWILSQSTKDVRKARKDSLKSELIWFNSWETSYQTENVLVNRSHLVWCQQAKKKRLLGFNG